LPGRSSHSPPVRPAAAAPVVEEEAAVEVAAVEVAAVAAVAAVDVEDDHDSSFNRRRK